jgi:putative membrane protein
VVTLLFTYYPVPTNCFFIGIIAGSIPQIYHRMRQPASALPGPQAILCCILALAVMVVMAVLKLAEESASYTYLSLPLFGILVAGGTLAAVAMIIPGISGSFLLLVIGLYRTIVQAVSELNVPLIIPVAIGTFIGLFLGAALVRFLLARTPRETYGAVLGLVAGSIIIIIVNIANYGRLGNAATLVFSVASTLAGCAISFFSGRQKS